MIHAQECDWQNCCVKSVAIFHNHNVSFTAILLSAYSHSAAHRVMTHCTFNFLTLSLSPSLPSHHHRYQALVTTLQRRLQPAAPPSRTAHDEIEGLQVSGLAWIDHLLFSLLLSVQVVGSRHVSNLPLIACCSYYCLLRVIDVSALFATSIVFSDRYRFIIFVSPGLRASPSPCLTDIIVLPSPATGVAP